MLLVHGLQLTGGRRVSQTIACLSEILPGNTESLKRGELKACPSDRCVTPILCENFKRGNMEFLFIYFFNEETGSKNI